LKLLIAYDQVFSVSSCGAVFTSGELGRSVLERYLEVFDEVLVVGRRKALTPDEAQSLSRCDGPGIRFAFLPNLSSLTAFAGARQRSRRVLVGLIEQCDFTLVRLPSEIGLLAADVARWVRPGRWGVELVGCVFDALRYHGSLRAALYAPLAAARVRAVVEQAPFVHYVTESFLQRRYPGQGQTAAFSDVLLPAPQASVMDRRLDRIQARPRPLVLGLIGTLKVRYKGIECALEALRAVRPSLRDLELRILGPGDPAPWVKLARRHGVDDLVHFDGVLPHGPQVFDWLDGLDVYLQPSLTEALPRGLIEAMSRALPVLGSRAGEIPRLIGEGWLHEPGDRTTLARHILAMECPRRQAMASRQNYRTARLFAPQRLAGSRSQWLETLHSAAASRLESVHACGGA
jgi:glycosyltransferase involved in cell wall biosynthesis